MLADPAQRESVSLGRGRHAPGYDGSKGSKMGSSFPFVTKTTLEPGVVPRNFEGGVVR